MTDYSIHYAYPRPPESEEFLAQMKPPSGQSYLHMIGGQVVVVNGIQPFAQRWRVDRELTPIHLDRKEEEELQELASFPLDDLAFAINKRGTMKA